jgi:hypothetical protein
VLGAPILFIVGDDPASFMLIRSLLVSIICLAVLVPMFVPKFNWAKDEKLKRHVAYATSEDRSQEPGQFFEKGKRKRGEEKGRKEKE